MFHVLAGLRVCAAAGTHERPAIGRIGNDEGLQRNGDDHDGRARHVTAADGLRAVSCLCQAGPRDHHRSEREACGRRRGQDTRRLSVGDQ